MTLTAEQLSERRNYIGASDVPALFNLPDAYGNEWTLYNDKAHGLREPVKGIHVDFGTLLERQVLDEVAKNLGPIEREPEFRHESAPHLVAHPDGVCMVGGHQQLIEVKTSGLFGPTSEEYGDEGSDAMPWRVKLQCYAQLAATETCAECHVYVVGRRDPLRHYIVKRHPETIETIRTEVEAWWTKRVDEKIAPSITPSLAASKLRPRIVGKRVDIPEAVAMEWADLRTKRLAIKKKEDKAKAAVLAAMGDAEIGDFGGENVVHFGAGTRRYLDQRRLQDDYPDIFDACHKEQKTRTLRLRKDR